MGFMVKQKKRHKPVSGSLFPHSQCTSCMPLCPDDSSFTLLNYSGPPVGSGTLFPSSHPVLSSLYPILAGVERASL